MMALVVPRTKRSTIGDRAFQVAAARVWNSMSLTVTQSLSLSNFRGKLKTELFALLSRHLLVLLFCRC